MKRMAIFVFYDFQGIVDEYVKYLVNSLTAVTEKIIIVSNGILDKRARKELEVFTKHIYERENKGFDAGAYKDVFMTYLKDESYDQWDEVILLNDTFYGPVYPWQEVFEKMDKQDVDFWGMTKQECYKWSEDTTLPTHVQSYFLAVRKSVLLSNSFLRFWAQLKYPEILSDAVLDFEVGFTCYFSSKGFKYTVYTDVSGAEFLVNKPELTYVYYMAELLIIFRMPLIKRKALIFADFEKVCMVFEHVVSHTQYDVSLILGHLSRLEENKRTSPFSYLQLDNFCKKFAKIYVYGKGKIGLWVGAYLQWKRIKFEKYIVSQKCDSDGDDVIPYSELDIDNGTGIILALGKKNTMEVLNAIISEVPIDNLLIPNYQIDFSNNISSSLSRH